MDGGSYIVWECMAPMASSTTGLEALIEVSQVALKLKKWNILQWQSVIWSSPEQATVHSYNRKQQKNVPHWQHKEGLFVFFDGFQTSVTGFKIFTFFLLFLDVFIPKKL
ncbi:hypothetical protein XENOCAPTIV_012442 [Xenoophorus captivus]|uniref:Uncharacterized protein n=1 Tax=Xenoophorus captivus TaxID=1517983 RepID=A0ABV0Q9K8_9TELE